MKSASRIFFVAAFCLTALLFAGDSARAEAIPPNPFASRMEGALGTTPVTDAGPAVTADSAITPILGLSVAGVVSSHELSVVTFRRGDDGVFSVALGDKIDDELQLVSIDGLYVSVLRPGDDALFKIEIPGAGDE